MRHALPLLFILSATPAFAQTVDVSGADALTGNLKRYIGTTVFDQGVVKISVQSDAYRVDVDFNKLLTLFPTQEALKLEVEPYAFSLKPRADGAWDMSGDMAPDGKIEFQVENQTRRPSGSSRTTPSAASTIRRSPASRRRPASSGCCRLYRAIQPRTRRSR